MKMISILAFYATLIGNAVAVGTVDFNNLPQSVGDAGAWFFNNSNGFLSGTNYFVRLYAGTDEKLLVPVGSPVAFYTGSLNGYFAGGQVDIPFVSHGAHIWVQVRAWEAIGGSSFEEAASSKHWTGISGILYVVPGGWGDPPFAPAQLFGLKYPGAPVVVVPPRNGKLRVGESAELTVIVSGGIDLSYQWYQGESGDTNQPVVGATNAVLNTSPLTVDTRFWASASTEVGSINSAAATVMVFPTSTVFLDLGIVDGLPLLGINSPTTGPLEIQAWDGSGSPKWEVLSTVVPSTNPFVFVDSTATNASARFYRAVRP